jgi:hypothetical protein
VTFVGVAASWRIDRRLPLLLLLLVLPGLTIYHGLPLAQIGGSTLDVRLLATGAVGVILAAQLVSVGLPRDRLTIVVVAWLAITVVLALGNEFAPLRALPVIGRYGAYVAALLLARRIMTGTADGQLVVLAVVGGSIVPALSGVLQFLLASGLAMNDATRLTGLSGGSPLGLALQMQIGGLVLYGALLSAGLRLPSAWRIAAWILFAIEVFVLVETASRLVAVTFLIGLLLVEGYRRAWLRALLVIVVALVIVLVDDDLGGRLTSTIRSEPGATPGPGETAEPGSDLGDVIVVDTSLGYRLFIWGTMTEEWLDSPIVGRGTGSFAILFERAGGAPRTAPHNDYFGVLVETGILGLAAYIAVQLAVLYLLYVRLRSPLSPVGRAIVLAAAVNFIVTNILSAIDNPILFLDLQVATWALVGAAIAETPVPAEEPAAVPGAVAAR